MSGRLSVDSSSDSAISASISSIPIDTTDPHGEGLAFFNGGGNNNTPRGMAVPFFARSIQIQAALAGNDSLLDRQPDRDIGNRMEVKRLQGRDQAAELV